MLGFMILYIWLHNLKEWANGLISNKAQKSQLHNYEILEIEQNYGCKAVSWIDHNFFFASPLIPGLKKYLRISHIP